MNGSQENNASAIETKPVKFKVRRSNSNQTDVRTPPAVRPKSRGPSINFMKKKMNRRSMPTLPSSFDSVLFVEPLDNATAATPTTTSTTSSAAASPPITPPVPPAVLPKQHRRIRSSLFRSSDNLLAGVDAGTASKEPESPALVESNGKKSAESPADQNADCAFTFTPASPTSHTTVSSNSNSPLDHGSLLTSSVFLPATMPQRLPLSVAVPPNGRSIGLNITNIRRHASFPQTRPPAPRPIPTPRSPLADATLSPPSSLSSLEDLSPEASIVDSSSVTSYASNSGRRDSEPQPIRSSLIKLTRNRSAVVRIKV